MNSARGCCNFLLTIRSIFKSSKPFLRSSSVIRLLDESSVRPRGIFALPAVERSGVTFLIILTFLSGCYSKPESLTNLISLSLMLLKSSSHLSVPSTTTEGIFLEAPAYVGVGVTWFLISFCFYKNSISFPALMLSFLVSARS